MKIVSVCKTYPTLRPGGMGFVCQDRAHALRDLGHEVFVVTTGAGAAIGDSSSVDNGITIIRCNCAPSIYSDQFAEQCVYWVNRISPDILHLDSFDVNRAWWTDVSPKPKTVAVTLHGFCWGAWMTKLNLHYRDDAEFPSVLPNMGYELERRLLQTFDRVIGISRHEHWMLVQLMGLYDAKLVYNPIAEYFFRNVKPITLNPIPRILTSAVSGQQIRGWHIVNRVAEKLGMEVVPASRYPREEMPEIIDSCDLMVLPTAYAQGMDLSVAEAIVRHRPVLASATGSYYRECTGSDGIYMNCMKVFPVADPDEKLGLLIQEVIAALRGAKPPIALKADKPEWFHHPTRHAKFWLEALQ